MTTVISRLYKNKKTANSVVDELRQAGFPEKLVDLISAADAPDQLVERIRDAKVPGNSAATYAKEMESGAVLLVVRAPFTPFGAALKAIEIVDGVESLASAVTDNEVLIRDVPLNRDNLSVMTGHPLFLTDKKEMGRNSGRISRGFGWRLLSGHKKGRSATSGGGYMSRLFWPMPLTISKKKKPSVNRVGV